MTFPLVKNFHFDGMLNYGNNILLGQAADILHLENHTKRRLQQLAALTRSLPDQVQQILPGRIYQRGRPSKRRNLIGTPQRHPCDGQNRGPRSRTNQNWMAQI